MSGKQSDFDILIEHGIDIRGRIVYLQGEIEEEKIDKFQKLVRYLDKTSGDITIVLDSEGGCVNKGFAAYDCIRECDNDVVVKVCGVAMSMASVILQAGDRRVITPNSRIMIHRGEIEVSDHVTNVENALKESKELEDKMMKIYLEKIKENKPNFKTSQLKKMLDFDTYVSAQNALELGLVDEVLGEDSDE
jgi:ATP-dependent Clp protease protease subunit